ncbi:MAG: hypothetical protein IJ860_07910 [Eubacterium sp.]|nr:hypothetical protein [Eubacterium sp.]
MSLLTTWGYSLTDIDTLPDMMDADGFRTMTGRSDDEDRVNAEISAACAAIRNYVGWHLAPAEDCDFRTIASDRRVTRVGRDMLVQLPARYVTEVTSVSINGTEYESFYADPNGLLRVFDVPMVSRSDLVVIRYTAGLTGEMLAPISELIAHRVTHALAVPPGITSEASGGVSVTYNATWINNSRATALAGDNKELLVPYKVQGVF